MPAPGANDKIIAPIGCCGRNGLSWRRENEDDVVVASVAPGEIGFDGEGRIAWVDRWCVGRTPFVDARSLPLHGEESVVFGVLDQMMQWK
jgi:hypothetical protein